MHAPLSIIIPTLNAEKPLLRLLPQLMEGLTEGLIGELILADGGSDDATPAIAEDAGARLVTSTKGRGTQLAAGGDAAKGTWLLFLHADSRLPDGWTTYLADHMSQHPTDAAAFQLAFDDPGMPAKITAGWANLRSKRLALPYGDQGLLIPSTLYRKIGGFDPIPLMEDVAIARKLRGHLRILPAQITTSAEKYKTQGWLKRGAHNLTTLVMYKLGRSPDALARRYDAPHHRS